MRRWKQQTSDERAWEMLREGRTGTLAITGDNGYPYSVPVNYTVFGQTVLFHGAKAGYKAEMLRIHPKVSMSVILKDVLDSEHLTTIFASVILIGEVKELQGEEKMRAAEIFARRYSDDQQQIDAEIERERNMLSMWSIDVHHITGKEAIEIVREREGKA